MFLPLQPPGSAAEIVPLDQTCDVDCELSFCFSDLLRSGVHDAESIRHLEELYLTKFAKESQLEFRVDGVHVERLCRVVSGGASCWLAASSYMHVCIGLFDSSPGTMTMSFFNGCRSLTGPPDEQLVASVLEGLLAGKLGILSRTEADPKKIESRRLGEWTSTKDGVIPKGMLLIVVSMYTKDGWTIDGSEMTENWSERVSSCSAMACSSLGAQLAERERQRKRQAHMDLIKDVYAHQTGNILESVIARVPESVFSRTCIDAVRNLAFNHEQTVAAVIERVIKEMYES